MAVMASPGMEVTLSITSDAASGIPNNHTFTDNLATVTNGTGSYSYFWTATNQIGGLWSFTASTNALSGAVVTAVASSSTATADIVCTVIDIIAGTIVASAVAPYEYTRL